MSISLYAIVPKPVVPNSVVASCPSNPITSAGVIAPTEEVATEGAVNGTPIPTTIDPTAEVAGEGAVGVNTCASLTVTDPILDVAETPLIPTTSAGVIAPTEDVKLLGAVNETITPVKTDPTPVVAETPDKDKLPDPNNKPGVPTNDVAD